MLEMPYLKKSTFPCTIMHQNMSSNLRKIAKRMARAKILVLSFCMFCLPNVSIGNSHLKKELKKQRQKGVPFCHYSCLFFLQMRLYLHIQSSLLVFLQNTGIKPLTSLPAGNTGTDEIIETIGLIPVHLIQCPASIGAV